ncbi:MAG: hypothetical protein PHH82_04460 [Candidatus ainarchaeum sp.]|nr:hypothetical protein [Candidatus ainarchaeum sp.]
MTKWETITRANSLGQLSIEFLIILFVTVVVISLFFPIVSKIYDYTTTTFDLANIKKATNEMKNICFLGDGSSLEIELILNKEWNLEADGNKIMWSSEYSKKSYEDSICFTANEKIKRGKYNLILKKNEQINLVIENSD